MTEVAPSIRITAMSEHIKTITGMHETAREGEQDKVLFFINATDVYKYSHKITKNL